MELYFTQENLPILVMVIAIAVIALLLVSKKQEEQIKNQKINPKETSQEIEIIEKAKEEPYVGQPIKKNNKVFNLQNVGWVGFAIVMFLLLSRDNDKRVYSINELGLTAETLVLDNDFQISVLDIVEDYCWVILNENHHSGYGRKFSVIDKIRRNL